MIKTDKVLKYILVESGGYPLGSFQELQESEKELITGHIVKEFINQFMKINKKINYDAIHKTKGDIDRLNELKDVSAKIKKIIEKLEKRNIKKEDLNRVKAYNEILKSGIDVVRSYSSTFKNFYNKKMTIGIFVYSTIVAFLIALSGLLFSIIDGMLGDQTYLDYSDVLIYDKLFNIIKNIVSLANSGMFKTMSRDLLMLREEIEEVNPNVIVESSMISSLVGAGFDALINSKFKIPGLGNVDISKVLYRASAIITFLYIIREIAYVLYNMNINIPNVLKNIKAFDPSNIKLQTTSFFNNFADDMASSYDLAQRRLSVEDKKLARDVNDVKNNILPEPQTTQDNNSTSTNDIDDFSDFIM